MTSMRREVLEIPAVVERLLVEGRETIRETAEALRAADPDFVITIARGSSDHAATFFKYACELTLGLPVASVGPSIASVYEAPLRVKNAACMGISQSASSLGFVETSHPLTDPIALIVTFYSFVERLADDLGYNPDLPRNLKKVTETI